MYEDETLEQGVWTFGFGNSYVCMQPSYILDIFVLMISSQLGLKKKYGGFFFSLTHILNNHCCYVGSQLVFWNIVVAWCYNTWQLCTPTNPNFHYIVNVGHAWLIFWYVNVLVLHQWYLICSFINFPFAWIWNLNLQCFTTYIVTLIKWLPFFIVVTMWVKSLGTNASSIP